MRASAAQSRFAVAAGGAGFLLVVAALLWAVGIAFVDGRDCGTQDAPPLVGLDTQRSLWPPGAECPDGSVAQLFSRIDLAIVILALLGLAILALGVLTAARDTRAATQER